MLIPKKEPVLNLLALCPADYQYMSEHYDPIEVFEELFSRYYLVDLRNMLYEMLKMASTHPDLEELCSTERQERFFFTYELLHDVVTAAYALMNKRKSGSALILIT